MSTTLPPEVDDPAPDPASPRPMDPRFRARRIEVKRDAGRRRLVRLGVVIGAVAVVLLAGATTQSPLLDVDRVQVAGMYRTSAEAIEEAGAIDVGDPLVSVDTGAAAARVAELPWVADVEVERHWPGTVRYEVHEREPAAVAVTADGASAVVDVDGQVVEVQPVDGPAPVGLPLLEGVQAPATPGERLPTDARSLLVVAAAVPSGLAERVASVRVGEQGVETTLLPTGVVVLGTEEELDDAFVALASVLAATPGACVGTIDVAVPSAPVLTPVPGCQ